MEIRMIRPSAMLLAAVAAIGFSSVGAAFARGGAPNVMDSPGYQRALQESRKRLQVQPDAPFAYDRREPRRQSRHHRKYRHQQ
jgi:hypothetical protein